MTDVEMFLRCLEIRSSSGIVAPEKLVQDSEKLFQAVKAKRPPEDEQKRSARAKAA